MATVLIQHGDPGPDGAPPPRAYFQLIEGKLHMPTIRDYFRLTNIALNGVVYPTDMDGFTYSTFPPNTHSRVTGDPLPGGSRLTRILLVRTGEVYGEPDEPGGKRRPIQVEENLGLWTLPPPDGQPRTLGDLSGALRSFLQMEHNISWHFKYRYQNELVPIASDASLAVAFEYFRAQSAQSTDDELVANQQCRLYLTPISEEMAPREIIRMRISGILDAAAAHSVGRESPVATAAVSPAPLSLHLPSAELQLLAGHPHHHHLHHHHHSHNHQHAAATAALAAAAAAGFPLTYGLALGAAAQQVVDAAQQEAGGGLYGMSGEGDGDDGEDGDALGEGGMMGSLPGFARPTGSEGASGGGAGGGLKKESKTRHADGRFKNEAQHAKKMADMSRKIAELFDGKIVNMVEVADHKKILCLLCSHACTAYSAYHTDCVRKHFLRHHEGALRERGVDVGRWRKDYEVSQKIKRQQQQGGDPQMASAPQMAPLSGSGLALNSLPLGVLQALQAAAAVASGCAGGGGGGAGCGAAGGGEGEGEAAKRSLQAQLLQLAGMPLDLQLPLLGQPQLAGPGAGANTNSNSTAGGAGGGGGGGGGGMAVPPSVSELLLQAQAVSQDEQLQIQTAGALSQLLTTPSVSSGGGSAGGASQV